MVLGTGRNDEGEVGFSQPMKIRCDRAAEAYFDSGFERGDESLLVTGGYARWLFEKPPIKREALLMADYLINMYNIPSRALLVEDQSTTTEENFTFSRDQFPEFFEEVTGGERKLAVVSHQNHLDKAALIGPLALACSARQFVMLPVWQPVSRGNVAVLSSSAATGQEVPLAADS